MPFETILEEELAEDWISGEDWPPCFDEAGAPDANHTHLDTAWPLDGGQYSKIPMLSLSSSSPREISKAPIAIRTKRYVKHRKRI